MMRKRTSNHGKNCFLVTFRFILALMFALSMYTMIGHVISGKAYQKLYDPGSDGIISTGLLLETSESSNQDSTELATKESLGFFTDIPDTAWNRHKRRFQLTQPNYINNDQKLLERYGRYSNYFWANNFEPEFTCPHEFRFGKLGDGGKWVCDAHRIIDDDAGGNYENGEGSCLVYSIGSNGNFDFEKHVREHISPNCEIHTFDSNKTGRKKDFLEESKKVPGVTFHHIGLGPPSKKEQHFKRFRDIIKYLKHEKKIIDVMKIDCERCEYAQFRQWLEDWKETGVFVRQLMLEVHNSDMPHVVDLFNEFQKDGFVLFHKEANYLNGANAVEVAWIQLSKDFQSQSSVAVETSN